MSAAVANDVPVKEEPAVKKNQQKQRKRNKKKSNRQRQLEEEAKRKVVSTIQFLIFAFFPKTLQIESRRNKRKQ